MTFTSVLGLIAAVLGMVTFLPQVLQCVKTRDTKSISLVTYFIILINSILWSAYGYLRGDFAIILVNIFIFANAGVIIAYKVKYG